MTFVLRASFLARSSQFVLRGSINKKIFNYSPCSFPNQISVAWSHRRFYGSKSKQPETVPRERLYVGTLHKRIRLVKFFSLMTSAGSLLCQPYLLSKAADTGGKVTTGTIIVVFGFFAFVTPLLLHAITKRYVVYMDYVPAKDTYIATTYSLFVRKKELEFRPEDVRLPPMRDMITTCMIKGKPMFMEASLFQDIEHYKRIMGFDKPMDFNLHRDDIKSEKD